MLSVKKDKKDEIIEQMQTRSTELMSENSRLQRDLTNGLEEITKVRQECNEINRECTSLKNSLKDAEHQI